MLKVLEGGKSRNPSRRTRKMVSVLDTRSTSSHAKVRGV